MDMDKIREYLENPTIVGVVGLVVGLFLGWFALGWGLFPVTWTDAAAVDLREDARMDYMKMALDSYAVTRNAAEAQYRWNELGDTAEETLASVEQSLGESYGPVIADFRVAVGAEGAPAVTQAAGEEAPAEEEGGQTGPNLVLLLVICLVAVVAGGGAIAYFILRPRFVSDESEDQEYSPIAAAHDFTEQVPQTDYDEGAEGPPLAQFMTTYAVGDDLFDDSFSIDSNSGEFLGECGVGISEAIGVGEPKKVAAFEVWLFDKNDIQTVTKVLMSEHAFSDPSVKQRLEAKGEPILAEPNSEMVLETATLTLVARVVDMEYGSGALPPRSFFERVTLDLAIWQK